VAMTVRTLLMACASLSQSKIKNNLGAKFGAK